VLAITKQQRGFNTTKELYEFVRDYMASDFPKLPSYQQFNEGITKCASYLVLMCFLFMSLSRQRAGGLYYVDSMPLPVCSNGHRLRAKIMRGMASSSKNLNGWYFGFKLHAIINHNMEIVSLSIETASKKDHKVLGESLANGLSGFIVGDKGYISQELTELLLSMGLTLVTPLRKNSSKRRLLAHKERAYMLKNRKRIESVFGSLSHRRAIVNRYARSVFGYFSQVFAAIVDYSASKIGWIKGQIFLEQLKLGIS
jgi:hypothetical protein